MKTLKAGSYSDPSVWDTSGGDRQVMHHVWIDQDVTCNERLYVGSSGKLEWRGATLTMNNKNLVVAGLQGIYSRPVAGKKSGLKFINLNPSEPVGSGMQEKSTDVGLWMFNGAKADIEATFKTPYSFMTASAAAGATSITVANITGWKVGDEIAIGTMQKPFGDEGLGWNEQDTVFNDEFFKRFERRTITGIAGNSLTLSGALTYPHNSVTPYWGLTYHCPVANLTRDFTIEGTPGKPAHWFMTSANEQGQHIQTAAIPHNIKNVEGRYLGQRHPGRNGGLVNGRYAMHFHHGQDVTQGTIVTGCSFHTITNRCFVPHQSNGITMQNNVTFDDLNQAYWWDDMENSHEIKWLDNLLMGCRADGTGSIGQGMLNGMGDDNVATGNLFYYCNSSGIHNNSGGAAWNANSEGVWNWGKNKLFCCTEGIIVWQNTGLNHTLVDTDFINCLEGSQHGAYVNSYNYINCRWHNAPLFVEAASGNTYGVVFIRNIFDAAGNKFAAQVIDSPAGSDPRNEVKFIDSTFVNHTVAGVEIASGLPFSNPEKQIKHVAFINATFTGQLFKIVHDNQHPLKDGYRVRVQPKTGQSYQVLRQNQQDITSNIADFTFKDWGTGTGLTGEYFLYENFESKKVTRIDTMVMFQGWTPDPFYAAFGVHHKVQGDRYSIRWTGTILPQSTGVYRFWVESWGGVRIWVNGALVMNAWAEFNDRVLRASSAFNVTKGTMIDVKIEHYNQSGVRGFLLHWEGPGMEGVQIIPGSQLYPAIGGTQPPPTLFWNVEKSGTFAKVCPEGQTGSQVAYVIAAHTYSSTISQNDADGKAVADINANGQKYANDHGTCSTTPPPDPHTLKAVAGVDKTVNGTKTTLDGSASTGHIASVIWYLDSGGNYNFVDQHALITEVNSLQPGNYVFQLVVKDAAGTESKDFVNLVVTGDPAVPADVCKQFKEIDYLNLHPDVAQAVANGGFPSGYSHWQSNGQYETIDGKYPGGRRVNKLCTSDQYWDGNTVIEPEPVPPEGTFFELEDTQGKTESFELKEDGLLHLVRTGRRRRHPYPLFTYC